MQLLSLLLLHLLWDTLVLFIILRVAIRKPTTRWQNLALVCFAMALCKSLLFPLLRVLAIVPVFLIIGGYLHWAYSLPVRTIVYVLATFLFVGIVFGSILRMAHGVLELFFV